MMTVGKLQRPMSSFADSNKTFSINPDSKKLGVLHNRGSAVVLAETKQQTKSNRVLVKPPRKQKMYGVLGLQKIED